MDRILNTFLEQTVNGLVIGNIYALIAVGIAIIFGVGNLINFAHGSVYMIGAYIGWLSITQLHTPLIMSFLIVAIVCGLLGIAIERFGLRGLQRSSSVAPLLATIGVSFILDQLVQIVFTPDPQAFPDPLPVIHLTIAGVNITAIDLLIAGVGIGSAVILYIVLRYTRLGWSLRATAQDRDAAQQMGVDVNAVNRNAFALASILGGIAGVLVGVYFHQVYPTMDAQAVLKGFTASLLGGFGNIPGAIAGGLILGLIESYGVALFGATYRNLFAFVILLAVLIFRPNGLFNRSRRLPPEPLTGTFVANSRPIHFPPWLVIIMAIVAFVLPLVVKDPYILQVLINAWLLGMAALSVTLVTGTAGQVALGQAGFVAIGAYVSALLTLRLNWSFEASLIAAGIITAILGVLLTLPAYRLRSHYVAIATIAIGQIVSQVILNWTSLTNGAGGLGGIAPPSLIGHDVVDPRDVYWYALAILIILALMQWRLVRSSLGRIWRAIREDDVAAQAYGINLNRYKALAFGTSALIAGVSGAFTAHMLTYISYDTFTNTFSILALTVAILGGLGNIIGAIGSAVLLTLLPELFRGVADYRYLLYGLALVLLIRFRPQGLFGTE